MAKTIEDIPLNDRPYEKLELFGSENLTNSELLAIVIKTGTTKNNCLEIAQNILKGKENISNVSDLEYLISLSTEELKKYDGIGRVKAIQIRAIIELSKRLTDTYISNKKVIISPKDVYNLVSNSYYGKEQECLKTIILNKKNKVLSVVTNAIGNSDNMNIGIKEVLSEPLKQMAHSIVITHNHPSGNLIPSRQDIHFTKKLEEAAEIFQIKLLDHIIISNSNYISLKEKGYI